jgi:carbamate kinase
MKTGDLVKIYDYTEKARAEARELNRSEAELKDINAHRYGLIIAGGNGPKYGHYREVLRSCDGESEFYNVVRLEVINESR